MSKNSKALNKAESGKNEKIPVDNLWINRVHPVDIIALFIIACGVYLKLRGADGEVGLLLSLVAGYYFGKRGHEIAK
jgi:hypothetical protein